MTIINTVIGANSLLVNDNPSGVIITECLCKGRK